MRGLLIGEARGAQTRPPRVPGQSLGWVPGSGTRELVAAAAILALVSVTLTGKFGVLLFFAGTGVLVALSPLSNARELLRYAPLLILPALAIVSTIWSGAPQLTMRMSLELFITFAAAIVICRNLRAERFLLAVFVGFAGILLTVLPAVPGSLAGGSPLAAYWGSKNSVGFAGYMVVALALALSVDRQQHWGVRLAAIGAIPLGLVVAYAAQSGGSTSTIVLTLLIFPPLAILAAMKLPLRMAIIIFVLLLFGIACFFLNDVNAAVTDFRVNVLKKDATLTGRTYLWDFADRLSASRPMLGYGYSAFWRQGNIDAEGLWRWGGIASRSGFNFHNAFVEMRIDLGLVGMSLLFLMCAGTGLIALARQAVAPSVALAGLIAMVAGLYVRSYVESSLVSPFSLASVIWLATVIYALTPHPLGSTLPAKRAVRIQRTLGRTPRATSPPRPTTARWRGAT